MIKYDKARSAWFVAMLLLVLSGSTSAQNYKRTDSRRPYDHHIELYDHQGTKIDPTADRPLPYSPEQTCMKCHDYSAISHGFHFDAASADGKGRAGEPWWLVDARTGTQLPLSYRDRPGTWNPNTIGFSASRFTREFGRHLPGGSPNYTGVAADAERFAVTGALEIDCLSCHAAGNEWSHERWAKQIAGENLAWASTAAAGLGKVTGTAKGLPDDFDPAAEGAADRLPSVKYDKARFAPDGTVFFDVVRSPSNAACYACHTIVEVGRDASPRWLHDGDIHLRAGMSCVDCHRNGLGHDTVRGYPGEGHPSGVDVSSLSCRGCHMDETDGHGEIVERGGRLGAPRAVHAGLPPLHLDALSCTACHAGRNPAMTAGRAQTSMAHGLGIPSQTRTDRNLPLIVEAVLRRDDDGVIRPHRMAWPAFWGWQDGDDITPILPDVAYKTVKRSMRVRKDMAKEAGKVKLTTEDLTAVLGADRAGTAENEWTQEEAAAVSVVTEKKSVEAFREKLAKTLVAMKKSIPEGSAPVYVSGGRAWRLTTDDGTVEAFDHPTALAVSWPVAHDVRPARLALGASGCTECHAASTPLFHGQVAALGPAPDDAPPTKAMYEWMGYDAEMIPAWERAFESRDEFKWGAFAAVAVVVLVLLLYLVMILGSAARAMKGEPPRRSRRRHRAATEGEDA